MMILVRTLAVLLGATLVAMGLPAHAQDAVVVFCHDETRGTVARMLAAECRGRVVSESEAAAIRDRRAATIHRAMQGQDQPVFANRRLTKIGTGFFVADGGRLVTNQHVVDECAALSVETTGGQTASAKLIRADAALDLAVLQANIMAHASAVFQPKEKLSHGSQVLIIGYPDQGLPPRTPFMSIGAAMPSESGVPHDMLAVRAEIRKGNSGGPVLDQWGQVVGVVRAKVDTVKYYAQTKQLVRDAGLAIRTEAVLRFLDQAEISYRRMAIPAALTSEQVFEAAKPFIVRVGCWH
jgi:S1-C subfamily serine protease